MRQIAVPTLRPSLWRRKKEQGQLAEDRPWLPQAMKRRVQLREPLRQLKTAPYYQTTLIYSAYEDPRSLPFRYRITTGNSLRKAGNPLCGARFHPRGGVFLNGAVLGRFVYGLIERREHRGCVACLFARDRFADSFDGGFEGLFAAHVENAAAFSRALCFLRRTNVCHCRDRTRNARPAQIAL